MKADASTASETSTGGAGGAKSLAAKTKSRSSKRDCPSSPVYRRTHLTTGASWFRSAQQTTASCSKWDSGNHGDRDAGTPRTLGSSDNSRREDTTLPFRGHRVWSRRCRSRCPPGRKGSQIAGAMELDAARRSRIQKAAFGLRLLVRSSGHEPCRRPVEHSTLVAGKRLVSRGPKRQPV